MPSAETASVVELTRAETQVADQEQNQSDTNDNTKPVVVDWFILKSGPLDPVAGPAGARLSEDGKRLALSVVFRREAGDEAAKAAEAIADQTEQAACKAVERAAESDVLADSEKSIKDITEIIGKLDERASQLEKMKADPSVWRKPAEAPQVIERCDADLSAISRQRASMTQALAQAEKRRAGAIAALDEVKAVACLKAREAVLADLKERRADVLAKLVAVAGDVLDELVAVDLETLAAASAGRS